MTCGFFQLTTTQSQFDMLNGKVKITIHCLRLPFANKFDLFWSVLANQQHVTLEYRTRRIFLWQKLVVWLKKGPERPGEAKVHVHNYFCDLLVVVLR